MKKIPVHNKTALSILIMLYFGISMSWMIINIGDIPPYGDTHEYLKLSQGLRVDEYRGILYPLFLNIFDLHDHFQFNPAPIQIIQITIFIISLSYFLNIFINFSFIKIEEGKRRINFRFLLFFSLLFFDPLITHFNLSIMTDSLCLSATMAFCAALADIRNRKNPLFISYTILLVTFLTAINLRSEKLLILIGTIIATCFIWWFSRKTYQKNILGFRNILLIIFLTSVCVIFTLIIKMSFYQYYGRWNTKTNILHQRIIYPHMSEIYDVLPGNIRKIMSKKDARIYDKRIHNTWEVINHITKGNEEFRWKITKEIALIAFKEKWPFIIADSLSDIIEHLFATPSYYVRLTIWMLQGKPSSAFIDKFETVPFTYAVFANHHRILSFMFAFCGGVIFGITLIGSSPNIFRTLRKRESINFIRYFSHWAPVLTFWILNATAFSLVANLVHIRYVIFSHLLFLLVLYYFMIQFIKAD